MNMSKAMDLNLRRKELPWDDEIWSRLDKAVYYECKRTEIASKFLPLHGPVESGKLTVPSDMIMVGQRNNSRGNFNSNTLEVPEAETTNLIELVVEFTLTRQQLEREEELGTALTLATRATNLLCQACDIVIFQGMSAVNGSC